MPFGIGAGIGKLKDSVSVSGMPSSNPECGRGDRYTCAPLWQTVLCLQSSWVLEAHGSQVLNGVLTVCVCDLLQVAAAGLGMPSCKMKNKNGIIVEGCDEN